MDVFHTLNDLKPFVFRITDNGGETADRYTIATCDGSYLSMSNNPYSPQGVCLTGDGLDPLRMDERVEAERHLLRHRRTGQPDAQRGSRENA